VKKLRAIDLFAGCGGLSEGFESSGHFEAVAHVEWEHAPAQTIRERLVQMGRMSGQDAEQRVLRFDMQRTQELLGGWKGDQTYGTSPGLIELTDGQHVDLIIGGPPCQAYSMAGRVRDENGMQFDYRNYLFEKYLEVVKRFEPDVFVFENVPGMLSAAPGGTPIVERIRDAFDRAGYEVLSDLKKALVDLSDYGVPQQRTRVIIVGLRKSVFGQSAGDLLVKLYSELLPAQGGSRKTASDAIGDLPRLLPCKEPFRLEGRRYSHWSTRILGMPVDRHHLPRFHSARDIAIFRDLAADAQLPYGKRLFRTVDDIKALYEARTGHTSAVHKYFVIKPDEQSNTIPAHLHKDGLRHIHWDPEQARSITVREAACLQSFDRDHRFYGSQSDAYKMIGNAVPPEFARRLARAVRELFASIEGQQVVVGDELALM
jgi:DNA (cytosine-5)-methyltransferase 1